jgi:hypothetical protein
MELPNVALIDQNALVVGSVALRRLRVAFDGRDYVESCALKSVAEAASSGK